MVNETESLTWYKWVLPLLLVLIGGSLYTFEQQSKRDLCAGGELWLAMENESDLYYCPSEDSYRYCYKLSKSERSCYYMELVNVTTDAEIIEEVTDIKTVTRVEYDAFWDTQVYDDNSRFTTLYSRPTWIPQDGGWVHLLEARTLYGYYMLKVLKQDLDLSLELVDINATSMIVRAKAENESAIYQETPIFVDGVEVSSVNFQSVGHSKLVSVNNIDVLALGNITLGEKSDSRTVTSVEDNATFADNTLWGSSGAHPGYNCGDATYLYVNRQATPYIRIALMLLDLEDVIGSGHTIDNLTLGYYVDEGIGSSSMTFFEVSCIWVEGDGDCSAGGNSSWNSPNATYQANDGSAKWTTGNGNNDDIINECKGATFHIQAVADGTPTGWMDTELTTTEGKPAIQSQYDENGNISIGMNITQPYVASTFFVDLDPVEGPNPPVWYIEWTPAAVDSCTPTAGQTWEVDCSDDCTISTGVDLSGNGLYFTGTGTFTLADNVVINNIGEIMPSSGCDIILNAGSELVI